MGLLPARALLCKHVRDRDYHADILAGTGAPVIPAQDALMAIHEAIGSDALRDIAGERRRQIEKEGWTASHDDDHGTGELALAASVYAYASTLSRTEAEFHRDRLYGRMSGVTSTIAQLWPWDAKWFKPRSKRKDLVRAGALIVAEIERLDRVKAADDAESLRIAQAC